MFCLDNCRVRGARIHRDDSALRESVDDRITVENILSLVRNAPTTVGFAPRTLRAKRARRGQALVEFAVVALVIYMLLAAILTFGQLLYSAQAVQQVTDSAAREISRTPLSPTADLMDVLYSDQPSDYMTSSGTSTVRTALFNPALLQYQVSPGEDFLNTVRTWPVINQMLYPLMVPANPTEIGGAATYLVYPGATPCTDSRNSNRTVYCVPEVTARAADGAETITWVPVIEEINPGSFSLASTSTTTAPGTVGLRINYPYQSATMSANPPPTTWPPDPSGSPPYGANDSEVATNSGGYYTPTASPMDSTYGTYSGQYGLGSQQAMARTVRPFRRLISAQAVYRREVFQ